MLCWVRTRITIHQRVNFAPIEYLLTGDTWCTTPRQEYPRLLEPGNLFADHTMHRKFTYSYQDLPISCAYCNHGAYNNLAAWHVIRSVHGNEYWLLQSHCRGGCTVHEEPVCTRYRETTQSVPIALIREYTQSLTWWCFYYFYHYHHYYSSYSFCVYFIYVASVAYHHHLLRRLHHHLPTIITIIPNPIANVYLHYSSYYFCFCVTFVLAPFRRPGVRHSCQAILHHY